MNEQYKPGQDNDILFSKAVKAGKRIYYIDVKQDRHNELYLSITESKRLKEAGEDLRPVFEKHKIFLFREDLERFMEAFTAAAEFTAAQAPSYRRRYEEDGSTFFSEMRPSDGYMRQAEEENEKQEEEEEEQYNPHDFEF